MSDTQLPDRPEMQRSSRDPEQLRASLERWLEGLLASEAFPRVSALQTSADNGMSSDTVLFDATWSDGGGERHESLVARIAPAADDVPVFPSYDLRHQYDVMDRAGSLTTVPVPTLWWFERNASVVGAPFLVMSRVEGRVPPDVMPYTFGDNWVFDAPPADQRRLQDATVGVLAELQGIDDAEAAFDFLGFDVAGEDALHRHVAHTRAWYQFAAADTGPSPLMERGFAWLDDHWPAHVGPTRLSWGDARIGNVLYRDFTPVAVLDWEMAGLGPPELDVAWLVTAHQVFEDLACSFELPGMPDFLQADDVCTTYEAAAGYTPRDLPFYCAYAAIQWGIVFLRTGWRQVHFGERSAPDSPDDLMHHRATLERLLAH